MTFLMIYPLDSVQLQHNCYLYNGHFKKKEPYDPILVQNRPNCNLHHLKKNSEEACPRTSLANAWPSTSSMSFSKMLIDTSPKKFCSFPVKSIICVLP